MFETQYEYSLAGHLSQAMAPSGLGMWKVCLEGRLCCTAVDLSLVPGDSYIAKKIALAALTGPDHLALVKSNGGMAINMTPGRAVWLPPGYMVSQHAKVDTAILTWQALPPTLAENRKQVYRTILASTTSLVASYPSMAQSLSKWMKYVEIEAEA